MATPIRPQMVRISPAAMRNVAAARVAPPPPVVAAATPRRPMPIRRQAQVLRVDPRVARHWRFNRPVAPDGKPRGAVTLPVSPVADITDATLFEAPADPAAKLYLQRYALAEEEIVAPGGGRLVRKCLAMRHSDGGGHGSLEVTLARMAPPGIDPVATGAVPLPHATTIELRFERPVGAVTPGAAMQKESRAFTKMIEQADSTIRATLELSSIAERDLIHMALTDSAFHAQLVVGRAIRIAVPVAGAPQLFREVGQTRECVVEPSPFAFQQNDPMFAGVTPPPAGRAGFVRLTAAWRNRHHTYYQDQFQRDVFYYLPDRFQIARDDDPPHRPTMSVRFEAAEAGSEQIRATMEYVALPVVEPGRFAAAAAELKAFCPEPRFVPLRVSDSVRFRLGLPGAIAFQERDGARVDLAEGIVDTVTLPLETFQSLFDALMGGSSVLLQGDVSVNLGDGMAESIPFIGRADAFAGDVLHAVEEPVGDGSIHVTLHNVIESPIQLRSMAVSIKQGDATVAAVVTGLDLSTPLQLAPGGEVSFTIAPAAPLIGDAAPDAIFDLSGVQVLPDRDALWNAVLDPSVPATYERRITVRGLADLFQPTAERPNDPIRAITVEFEGGEAVELTPDQLSPVASLRLPIADLVLRHADAGTYRYRLRIIRPSGQTVDSEWRSDAIGILHPPVQR